jgi:hypothetical protein
MSLSERQWLLPIVITIQTEEARNLSHIRLLINSVGKQFLPRDLCTSQDMCYIELQP